MKKQRTYRSFLTSVVRQRIRLVSTGESLKNPALCIQLCDKMTKWVQAWNPSEENVKQFIVRHRAELLFLLPPQQTSRIQWLQSIEP